MTFHTTYAYSFLRHHANACTSSAAAKNNALLVHTSWIINGQVTTTDLEDVDLAGLVDSFIATQRVTTTTLTIWLHQRTATASDPASSTAASKFNLYFETRYYKSDNSSKNNSTRQVRFVDAHSAMAELAAQTCIGTAEEMYHPPKLQSQLELFRVVVLTVQGGLYIEPDHLFTRGLQRLVEIAGEFVVQQPMSQMLSTSVMHLDCGSKVGHGMLKLVCKWPQSNDDRSVWEPFCKEVRMICF